VLDESGIVQSYILDFYCSKLKLAIELDGAYHPNQKEKDQERDENLLRIGIRTLRGPSRSFFNDKWLFESIEELIRPA
jgi:very-short-patch-repair endonuclease